MNPYQRSVSGPLLVLAVCAAVSCQPSGQGQTSTPGDLAIIGATLIDGTGAPPRPATTVVIRDGRIAEVAPDGTVRLREGTDIIEAAGKYVIPGLADMHVHLSLGSPMPRRPGTTETVLARELYYGVTSILAIGMNDASTESIQDLRARRANRMLEAPYIYGTGGHLTLLGTHPVYTISPPDVRRFADSMAAETPLSEPVNLYPLGIGLSIVRTEEAARKAVRERAEGGMNAIKITVESGPSSFGDDHPQMSVEMIHAIVEEAREHGLGVFAHISSLDELEATLDGGAAAAVHAVWDIPYPDSAHAAQMVAANFSMTPTLSLFVGRFSLGYRDESIQLDDPFLRQTLSDEEVESLRDAGYIDRLRRIARSIVGPGRDPAEAIGDRIAGLLANVGMLHDRGVRIVVGTDTGNPYVFPGFSVHQELELLVRAGLTPMEALEAATRRAAEMIDAGNEFGTIEPGKRADLLVLGGNPLNDIRNTRSLETVIAEGRVVDRDALPIGIR
jgi:imidazolonepropionase-like amidohydrolase